MWPGKTEIKEGGERAKNRNEVTEKRKGSEGRKCGSCASTEVFESRRLWSGLELGLETRLPSNLRQDHPRVRAFSYACSLPFTHVTKMAATPLNLP